MEGLILSEERLEELSELIAKGTRDFIRDAGARGAVMGLSGGIDSALVAMLASKALGKKLNALVMPEIGVSREEDVEDAIMLAKKLDIPYRMIKINQPMNSIKKILPELKNRENISLAKANLAPRIRMILNYAVSNMDELIVLGTGNKTELYLGYFTKYGDGGADFLPIGDLYKSQVRQLACHLKLPQCFLDKPPSAGLWHGQTDEDELGETYENLDRIIFHLVDRGHTASETASALELGLDRVERVERVIKNSSHKRSATRILKLS